MERSGRLFQATISIPSGAIKRPTIAADMNKFFEFQFLLVRLKVRDCSGKKYVMVSFQFLLVRLKVRQEKEKLRRSQISIPSGAIKRTIGYGHTKDVLLFQFLLVRLKEVSVGARRQIMPDFNSFWCD